MSLGLSERDDPAWVVELYGGMRAACDEYALSLVGGDLNRSERSVISVTRSWRHCISRGGWPRRRCFERAEPRKAVAVGALPSLHPVCGDTSLVHQPVPVVPLPPGWVKHRARRRARISERRTGPANDGHTTARAAGDTTRAWRLGDRS